MKFEIFHTPGETPDALTVWMPKYKAAFVGDNVYDSFPNIYTLRGTQPRWALDYVASINKVLALKPGHRAAQPRAADHGHDENVVKRLTKYRDAIQYVHDATVVQGMNDGKDVFTLMREIKLPPELEIGETYGKVAWSVRGIYEGYVGWFDLNPATMYGDSAQRGRRRPGRAGRRPAARGRAVARGHRRAATPCAVCGWPTRHWRASRQPARRARGQAACARDLAEADPQRLGARLAGLWDAWRAEVAGR